MQGRHEEVHLLLLLLLLLFAGLLLQPLKASRGGIRGCLRRPDGGAPTGTAACSRVAVQTAEVQACNLLPLA